MAQILVIGATGFIGSEIARDLGAAGYDVRLAARDLQYGRRLLPDATWVHADLNHLTDAEGWAAILSGCNMVINASGLLQSGAGDDVGRIQEQAVIALAAACATAEIERIIQISAAGIDGNNSDFMTTKARADEALLAGPVPAIILRPGLVIGRNAYGGTQLIRTAAALPVGMMPAFAAKIRCIAMADLVEAVRLAVEVPAAPRQPVDLVGTDAHGLADIIVAHRRWLGVAPWRLHWSLPGMLLALVSCAADALGLLGWRSPLRRNAITALAHGVDGDAAATRQWLGRAPLTLEAMLANMPAGTQDRQAALAALAMPVALATLFLMWGLSCVATLIDLPRASQIMAQGGVPASWADALTLAGALADGTLALLLLHRSTTAWALKGMILLAAAYLVAGTVLLPGLWLDPLAPYAKVLPTMVLAAMLLPTMARR